jgi:hypothetical protein
MRVTRQAGGCCLTARVNDAPYVQPSEDDMEVRCGTYIPVGASAQFDFPKPAEEQKQVAGTNAVAGEVPGSGTCLAKGR